MASPAWDRYTIAWVCALPLEAAAASVMLDKIHPSVCPPPSDPNAYVLGELNGHFIVIACLPTGIYGTISAATVLAHIRSTFARIQFALMVGIGGGVPSAHNDIRLGDVVVSRPGGRHGGVIQYDYGKTVQGRKFEQTGMLNHPPQALLTHMSRLQAAQMTRADNAIATIVADILARNPHMEERFAPSGPDKDYLFSASYQHPADERNCDHCEKEQLVPRKPRGLAPHAHYGLIASGDQVMKDAETRDTLAQQLGVLCFEMEAAGLMNQLPTLVIRGICDYCDSHKQKDWQGYAALTAAAYTKGLLSMIPASTNLSDLIGRMDDSTVPPQTSPRSVVDDSQQPVALVGSFLELVGRPILSLWQRKNLVQAFKQKLGEWAEEAIDQKGRWLQPVLRSKAFEDHLKRENGQFLPAGRCEASFAWAQFLFALNIRPGTGVLAWRLPPIDFDPALSNNLSLEVDGDVMCHIINLYRLYREAAPTLDSVWGRDAPEDQCRLPFGRLSMRQVDDRFVATFEPGPNADLSSQRLPLYYRRRGRACLIAEGHLRFERDGLVADYFKALDQQASDTARIGNLPDPCCSMKERAQFFIHCRKMLQPSHRCDDICGILCSHSHDPSHVCVDSCVKKCPLSGESNWHRPSLVTPIWLEELSRIKRRVTTDGGENMGLLHYIVSALHDRPKFVLHTTNIIRGNPSLNRRYKKDGWEAVLTGGLKRMFLFSHQKIRISWDDGRRESRQAMDSIIKEVKKELPRILKSLAEQAESTWLHQLSDMVPETLALLAFPNEFKNAPVAILELGPGHGLWGSTCEIQGQ